MRNIFIGMTDAVSEKQIVEMVSEFVSRVQMGNLTPLDVRGRLNTILDHISDVDINLVNNTVIGNVVDAINPILNRYGYAVLDAGKVRDDWENRVKSPGVAFTYDSAVKILNATLANWTDAVLESKKAGIHTYLISGDEVDAYDYTGLDRPALVLYSSMGMFSQVSQMDGTFFDRSGREINLLSLYGMEEEQVIEKLSGFDLKRDEIVRLTGLSILNSRLSAISFGMSKLGKPIEFDIDASGIRWNHVVIEHTHSMEVPVEDVVGSVVPGVRR